MLPAPPERRISAKLAIRHRHHGEFANCQMTEVLGALVWPGNIVNYIVTEEAKPAPECPFWNSPWTRIRTDPRFDTLLSGPNAEYVHIISG